MGFIFEFLMELVLEGSISLSKNRNVPRFIRYPLRIIVLLFFAAVVGFVLFMGISLFEKSVLGGAFITLIGAILLFGAARLVIR